MKDDKIKLTAVFTKDEAAKIKAAAHRESRSTSNYIRKIISEKLLEESINEMDIQAAQ